MKVIHDSQIATVSHFWLVFKILFSASFVTYLIKINDVWDFVLDDMYQIAPCKIPLIDTVIDTSFEYSIFVNLLLVCMKKW